MRFTGKIFDDVMRNLLVKLLATSNKNIPSRGGTSEILGTCIEIQHPRSRISRTETRGKPFSCLGELLWYLSGGDGLDFIKYYIPHYEKESEDGESVYGAYGPRLFNQRDQNQIFNVVNLLKERHTTRRAVIQIFNSEDISSHHKEIPCTTTLQFMIRNNRLIMITTMRSNDAYKGLPHDIFCFTMIQEIIARMLSVEPGKYIHFSGNMHLYDEDRENAQQYVDEAFQPKVLMPPMPEGDPWPSIRSVLEAERQIRNGITPNIPDLNLDSYWEDLIRLLQIFSATGDAEAIDLIKADMKFKKYSMYIEPRKSMNKRQPKPPHQYTLL